MGVGLEAELVGRECMEEVVAEQVLFIYMQFQSMFFFV